jgi:hypothetical protein
MVDYVRPNGEEVMRTIADYRQLNDALFHAGLDSGSEFEWEDPHNRLHFYVIDLERNPEGILSYTLGVRSQDGSSPQERGVSVSGPSEVGATDPFTPITFTLTNTGTTGTPDPSLHPDDATAYLSSDLYRLSVSVEGEGWSARLLNALVAVEAGGSRSVTVYVSPGAEASEGAAVTLSATSETDPSKTASATTVLGG